MTKAYQSYAIGHLQGQGYLIDLFDCGSIQKGTCKYFLAGGCWVVEKELRNDQAIHGGTPHHTTPTYTICPHFFWSSLCQDSGSCVLAWQMARACTRTNKYNSCGLQSPDLQVLIRSKTYPLRWANSSAWEILVKSEATVFGEFIALSLDLTSSGGFLVESFPKGSLGCGVKPLFTAPFTTSLRVMLDQRIAELLSVEESQKGRCSMGPGPKKSSALLSTRMILLLVGGGFKYFLMFTPIWGIFPIWLLFFK